MNIYTLLLLSLLFFTHSLKAQQYKQGEIIVRIKDNYSTKQLSEDLYLAGKIRPVEVLSKQLNCYRYAFDSKKHHADYILQLVRESSVVQSAQLNYLLKPRLVPNDAQYSSQWQYEQASDIDLDAEAAWDITTGGLTAMGDTIVVCVIDGGLQINHPDLAGNIWYNHAEIPNNGIDDDNNGYVDDYRGWNAYNDNDDITNNTWHGTPVAGIVGARGNNGLGVSGVNWKVKIMFVAGGGDQAASIKAYSYPLQARKRYAQSNGTEGAFVVATNASWGTDNQQCLSYAPVMNELYDTLGHYGILNAAATANQNTNVDTGGDFPTTCPSEHLIAVTNMNQSGQKVSGAGYGSTHIDLGAFGAGTFTLASNSNYNSFGGTSGATPHVAGAIALLYSSACPKLIALAKSNPSAANLLIKRVLLSSTVPNSSLQGITVSEGVLNLKNALDSLLNGNCTLGVCHQPLIQVNASQKRIDWWASSAASSYNLSYRLAGTSTWTSISTSDTFYLFNSLTDCSEYEVKVTPNCDTSLASTINFTTSNCCLAPLGIQVDQSDSTSATLSWNNNTSANSYQVEYKALNASNWTVLTNMTSSLNLLNLSPCTEYELRILSSCNSNVNNQYSPIFTFSTKGCGSCYDNSYCSSKGNNTTYEWIERFKIHTLDNQSGNNNGYATFIDSNLNLVLEQGKNYTAEIEIGVGPNPFADWNITGWIDFDQDGILDNSTEQIFTLNNLSSSSQLIHTANVTIPTNAQLGNTFMRINFNWNDSNLPCSTVDFGEIEDYCLTIDQLTSSNSIQSELRLRAFPIPFNQALNIEIHSPQEQQATLLIFNALGQVMKKQNIELGQGIHNQQIPVADLSSGMYILELQLENGQHLQQKICK